MASMVNPAIKENVLCIELVNEYLLTNRTTLRAEQGVNYSTHKARHRFRRHVTLVSTHDTTRQEILKQCNTCFHTRNSVHNCCPHTCPCDAPFTRVDKAKRERNFRVWRSRSQFSIRQWRRLHPNWVWRLQDTTNKTWVKCPNAQITACFPEHQSCQPADFKSIRSESLRLAHLPERSICCTGGEQPILKDQNSMPRMVRHKEFCATRNAIHEKRQIDKEN